MACWICPTEQFKLVASVLMACPLPWMADISNSLPLSLLIRFGMAPNPPFSPFPPQSPPRPMSGNKKNKKITHMNQPPSPPNPPFPRLFMAKSKFGSSPFFWRSGASIPSIPFPLPPSFGNTKVLVSLIFLKFIIARHHYRVSQISVITSC